MTNLEKARMLIKRNLMTASGEDDFSVETFSERSVDRLIEAMSGARKEAKPEQQVT